MAFDFPPFILVFFIGSLLAIFIAWITWVRRPAPGSVPLTLLLLCIAWWLFGGILEAGAVAFQDKVFWGKIEFFGIASTGIFWLFFSLDYSGAHWWRKPRYFLPLAIIPVAALVTLWTNQFHNTFWTSITPSPDTPYFLIWEHGWSFWIFWTFQYLAVIYGIFHLWRFVLSKRGLYWHRLILVLVGTTMPLIGNIIYVFGFSPIRGLDLTPFVFVLAGYFYGVSILRYHLINPITVARNVLIEKLPDGILILDSHRYVADINTAGERIINLKRFDAIGRSIDNIWPKWPATINNNDAIESKAEITLDSPRGNRYFNLTSTPLRNNKEKIIGRLVLLQDISERKESQKLLETLYNKEYKLRHDLQQEMEKRDNYVRAIIHELKTPLTAILASGELLEAEFQDKNDTLSSLVRNIRHSSFNLERRINELLDLARGEIGILHLDMQPLNIIEIIRVVESEMVSSARSKGLLLESSIDETIPPVRGDKRRLHWVLTNLVKNSIAYTPAGKVIIHAGQNGDKSIHIKVEDTGPGISEAVLPHLFDPYLRRKDDKDRLRGLGIGLALSKIFVELHNGKIWAENNAQQGATLHFTLPVD